MLVFRIFGNGIFLNVHNFCNREKGRFNNDILSSVFFNQANFNLFRLSGLPPIGLLQFLKDKEFSKYKERPSFSLGMLEIFQTKN